MKKSRITTALLAIGISASMVFQTPVFATEETAVAVSSGITTNGISGWPQGPEITSASAVIMEDTSDTILYAKDMDTTLSPAGAVKIMTCLLALENSQLDDQVTMTETGVSGVTDGGAHISSQLGEVFTMEQCLYALMLASANDIAVMPFIFCIRRKPDVGNHNLAAQLPSRIEHHSQLLIAESNGQIRLSCLAKRRPRL